MLTNADNKRQAELAEGIRLEPQEPKYLMYRSKCFCDLRQYDKALAYANEAIRLSPRLPGAWALRGFIRMKRKEDDAAFADFSEAIRLNSNSIDALYYRGYAQCYHTNQYEGAEKDLSQAIRLMPEHGFAILSRARANWHLGRPEQALADYDSAINLLPKYPPYAYVARGQYYKCHRLFELAISDFSEAIGLSPHDGTLLLERGNAYLRKGDLSQAIQDFTDAIQAEPKNYMAYQSRARALRALSQTLDAEKDEQNVRELRAREKMY
jgi:tetratricopeptide (TPR) repeat protein